jgi:2-keto-4-pentenoate hydratase/2-oxohepta-3-ene-1,7-dioic acid hydratase in catechol pathway
MRIYSVAGRAALGLAGGVVDIEDASRGAFSSDPQALYDRWDELCSWAAELDGAPVTLLPGDEQIWCPVPRPRQIFAIGINYGAHGAESGLEPPTIPMVFAKFPASITGPFDSVALPEGAVDFEVELVVVIGAHADRVAGRSAWRHVAGLTVGQDLSERNTQWQGSPPQQMSLGKSFPGFSPLGPSVVSPDEFANPDDIALGCSVNGTTMQQARTSDMIFAVPALIQYISSIVPLLPGDVIFTGTPSGIGFTRRPQVLLKPGDELTSYVEGIGEMRHTFTERSGDPTAELKE